MPNKVEIQVEVVGTSAAMAQLAALSGSASASVSASHSPAASSADVDVSAAATKAVTEAITEMTKAQAHSSAPMLAAAAAMKQQQKETIELTAGMSALEQANMSAAGLVQESWSKSAAAINATSGSMGGLIEKLKLGQVASGSFWGSMAGSFIGNLGHRAVMMGAEWIGSLVSELNAEIKRGTDAQKLNDHLDSYEGKKEVWQKQLDNKQKSLLDSLNEKSSEDTVVERWRAAAEQEGSSGGKNSRRFANMGGASADEFKAEVKAENERRELEKQQQARADVTPAQRDAMLSDLQKRMDAEFAKGGNTKEYQRLSGIRDDAQSGKLAAKYYGKNALDQVSLEDVRSQSELEKAKSHADIKENLNQQLAGAKAGRDFKGVSSASELLKALDSGELAKLGGEGGETKGLEKQKALIDARFKEQEATLSLRKDILAATGKDKELAKVELEEKLQEMALKGASKADLDKAAKFGLDKINGMDKKVEEIQRPSSMVRGSQEAFSAQLGPVMQDPIKTTQENTRVMTDLKNAIDRALQGGTIVVVGRNA